MCVTTHIYGGLINVPNKSKNFSYLNYMYYCTRFETSMVILCADQPYDSGVSSNDNMTVPVPLLDVCQPHSSYRPLTVQRHSLQSTGYQLYFHMADCLRRMY
jgi:hypothetical protein